MAAAVTAVAALAYWDAERESSASLQDFAQDQSSLAQSLATALGVRASADGNAGTNKVAGGAEADDEGFGALRVIERSRVLRFLRHRSGESVFRSTDGAALESPRLLAAVAAHAAVARIPRDEAPSLGLHARTALAGIGYVAAGTATPWEIIAVTSAERQRDREAWARRRLVLSVLTAAGLVLAFGGLAMRTQRNELTLERELAIATLRRARDERLERASKAAIMGTLAMGVAHEIATPLGVIVARAEQLLARASRDPASPPAAGATGDPRLHESVTSILAQAGRIDQVMRGLLGLARGDAPALERIEVPGMIADAVELVEHRFSKLGVQLVEEVAPGLPTILGDPRLLEHAVVNLLLNAADACKAGGEVAIRVRRDEGELEISVEDTGPGISPSNIGRALEPFFTTKAREGGTGLGLAIAQEIVANHRGRLALAALKPRGTRATIRLPPAEEGRGDG